MKTVREISDERSLDRSTLLKAAQRSIKQDGMGAWARRSGETILIDDESDGFKRWLAGASTGRPRGAYPETIKVDPPDPPDWVNTDAARHAWNVNLNWRVNAARTTEIDTEYRKVLMREAARLYSR